MKSNSSYKVMIVLAMILSPWQLSAENFSGRHQEMINDIEETVRETRHYLDKERFDQKVMDVMAKVPRHEFVPSSQLDYAYQNRPLPIGYGQTISQPYIVALMTDLIETRADDKVLEIGTGSAYQAAVLSELVKEVYSIEVVKPLGEEAARRLQRLNYNNVHTRIGDGYYGWPEQAPFDAILVTAAASHVPPPLINQLKPGGRMVIPVGSRFMTQQLLFVEKALDGSVSTRQVMPVIFVPLTGKH